MAVATPTQASILACPWKRNQTLSLRPRFLSGLSSTQASILACPWKRDQTLSLRPRFLSGLSSTQASILACPWKRNQTLSLRPRFRSNFRPVKLAVKCCCGDHPIGKLKEMVGRMKRSSIIVKTIQWVETLILSMVTVCMLDGIVRFYKMMLKAEEALYTYKPPPIVILLIIGLIFIPWPWTLKQDDNTAVR